MTYTTELHAGSEIRPCTVYRHTDGKVCGQSWPHALHFPIEREVVR